MGRSKGIMSQKKFQGSVYNGSRPRDEKCKLEGNLMDRILLRIPSADVRVPFVKSNIFDIEDKDAGRRSETVRCVVSLHRVKRVELENVTSETPI